MYKILLSLAAITSIAGWVPASSMPMIPYHPVHILSCVVMSGRYESGIRTHGIFVEFVNTYRVPARRVDFYVDYHGYRQRFNDVGMFTQGSKIRHSFYEFINLPWSGENPTFCHVERVRLANGRVVY